MKGMRPGRLLVVVGTLAVMAAASSPKAATADAPQLLKPTLPVIDYSQQPACSNGCTGTYGMTPCNPGRPNDGQNGMVGWTASSANNGAGGVYAKILNYTPYVAYPDVSAWVMLTVAGTAQIYAQVGWLQSTGNRRNTFTEWTNSAGYPTFNGTIPPEPPGYLAYYTVLYNNTPNELTFFLDGQQVGSATADWFPTVAENMGENQTSANQMPGNYSYPEDFSDVHVWLQQGGGGWLVFGGVLHNSNATYYNASIYSTTHMQIGDKACTG